MDYKYCRIQGWELAPNTLQGKGVFSMCMQLLQKNIMEQEDADLLKEIDAWFTEELPWPPQCKNQEKVICFYKTENSAEMMKMTKPLLWLLDKYDVRYYVMYTNNPGEIVYEDKYQVVVKAEVPVIGEMQQSWTPPDK